jgi:outer membrane protein assembly factor BamB
VVGNRALTQEQEEAREWVTCYDLATGRRLWAHGYEARYDNPIGGLGPRATPTVVGDRVYAIGATGMLVCLELGTGNLVWGTNVVGTVPAQDLEWGVSSSPLVLGDRVVVAPRGVGGVSLLAVSAVTGHEIWRGGTASAHYSSPRLETLLGVPQILTFTGAAAAGHDPGTGALLWEQPWRGGHPHVADPRVVRTNQVLISSGYGTGSRLVEVRRTADGQGWLPPEEVWRSMRLKSKFANVLLKDGFVYGLDDGKLVCLDLENGERRWEGERYGHGQLLLVDDVILLTTEQGEVVQVGATPEAFRERHRFAALEGKTWNPPALAGNILVVRNDREATAFRLPVRR